MTNIGQQDRVNSTPEITTDGWHPYKSSIRDAFGKNVSHGVINKTYSVTHLNVTEASRRYSPAAVVAVSREVVSGEPEQISTSYVERQNLTIRMALKRFARLSNGFSKRLECHLAAVALHVAFYNLCRVHESLRGTPAMALGIADRIWNDGRLARCCAVRCTAHAYSNRTRAASAVPRNSRRKSLAIRRTLSGVCPDEHGAFLASFSHA